jgi:hypothetical protein
MIESSTNGCEIATPYRTLFLLYITGTVLLFWSPAGSTAASSDDAQAALPAVTHSVQIPILDGKSFSGELGLLGEAASSTDLLEFRDGIFISRECERKCGYTEGIYWLRPADDGIEVMSETPCLESDATIVWRGTVKDDKIEGTFTWTSKRWYWTIEKEFWFNGVLVDSGVSANE